MHPNDVAIIKRLQPYAGADTPSDYPLARLSQLSNWDKHREFHFAGQSYRGSLVRIEEDINATGRILYAKPAGEILEHDTVILRLETRSVGPNPQMNMDMSIIFDVAFGKGSPLEGLGIEQTLTALGFFILDILNEFKPRFDNQDFSPPF